MSTAPGPQQVRDWSEELARDPRSYAYFPLADAYRRDGRAAAALRMCVRGLERHPEHVEGHFLLGLLYRDGGDLLKAFDEWDIALRLDPSHGGSRLEIARLSLERGDAAGAARHLDRALEADPGDAAALALMQEVLAALPPEAAGVAAPSAPRSSGAPPAAGVRGTARAVPAVPSFDDESRALADQPGMVGVVLLDEQGYVLKGEMRVGGSDRAPEVAAALRGASDDAERAVRHLDLGAWRGILLETAQTVVHLSPVPDGMLAVAATREVPMGWVVRTATRLRRAAERLLGGAAEESA